MTATNPAGGAAIPVSVDTTRKVQGGAAIPVYGYMTAPTDGRPALGGPAVPVRVLTAADLKVNGGQWTLEGRPYAMPVYTAPATTTVMGGPALAVYPVNAWPTVAAAPLLYILDQFTGADDTLITARPMDTGEAWTAQLNNCKIATNRAIGNTLGLYSEDTVLLPSADMTIDITLNYNDDSAREVGIIGRYTDATHYWKVFVSNTGNGFRIVEVNGGETVRAFSDTKPVAGTDYTLRAVFDGSTITATFRSVSISYASATFNQTEKAFGIRVANNPGFQDNIDYFLAWKTSYGASPPPNPIYPFSLSRPLPYEVIQRSGTTANIPVTGTIATGSGTHSIEASFNGGDYQTIASNVTGGSAFSGTLTNQAQGQGTLRVRYVDATGTYQDTAYVGIGDVFVIAGQSNAAGGMTNGQSYSHASLKACSFGNDYAWHELTDPTDSNVGQVDSVSYDINQAGSYWPLLATSFLASQSVPVAFIPCALYACSISQWQPGADHEDRTTLYGSMVHRAKQISGGIKAVLFHHGETDANSGMAQATYNAYLDTLANAVQADLGVDLMPAKIHHWTGAPATPAGQIDAIIGAVADAIADNTNVTAGPDMSSPTDVATGLHIGTDAEGVDAAGRWWAALQTAFGYA